MIRWLSNELHGEVAPQEWVPRDGVAEPATNVAAGGLGPVALHDDHSSTSSSMAPPPLAEQDHLLSHLGGRRQDMASIVVVWLELRGE
jgi:hypothetical protein